VRGSAFSLLSSPPPPALADGRLRTRGILKAAAEAGGGDGGGDGG